MFSGVAELGEERRASSHKVFQNQGKGGMSNDETSEGLLAECLPCLLDYDGFVTMLNKSLGNFKFNSNLNIFCFLSSSFWLLFRPAQKPENMIRIHLNNSSNLAFINKDWSICQHLIQEIVKPKLSPLTQLKAVTQSFPLILCVTAFRVSISSNVCTFMVLFIIQTI